MSSQPGKSTGNRGIEFDDDYFSYQNKCLAIAAALHENGAVIIKDNRVSVTDNDAFIDMMERFVCLRHPSRLIDSQND
jgi:hypothetical protein